MAGVILITGGGRGIGAATATVDRELRLDQMDGSRLERMFAINVIGSMLCAREAVRRMSTRYGGHGGSIVNVSSAAAKHGSAGTSRRTQPPCSSRQAGPSSGREWR